jgi:UDP-2,3-diacylglucosamine pyrophosphatase LpxH
LTFGIQRVPAAPDTGALAQEARHRGFDGVVCGHIRKAEICELDGILYCNDSDWVESLTALVETMTVELRVLHWHDICNAALKWSNVP